MSIGTVTHREGYHHVAVYTRSNDGATLRVEHWQLTDNEVERIRERAVRRAHLAVPPMPTTWWQRFRAWVTSG